MRIVHVVRQFAPAIGGLENFVKDLAISQLNNGHNVRVVTIDRIFNSQHDERLPRLEWIDGIEIVRLPYFGSKRYPVALSAIRHIKDADVVHVHGVDFFFDYLAWTRPFHRRRLIASTHGGFFHTPFAARLKRLYFLSITRASLTWYSAVATVSASDDELFSKIRRAGACLIENGIEVDKYLDAGAKSPKKALLTIGRLSSNKRLDHVVRFLAAIRRIDPEWRLYIAGRPWDVSAASLMTLADSIGIGDAIQIFESASSDQIRSMMAECSAFVSASKYEGFGVAVIEALSAGLWPVMSEIPPFQQLVDRTGVGMTVNFEDADAAAHRFLSEWRTITRDYERTRSALLSAAEGFQWSQVSKKYEALYDSILGNDVRTILGVPILVRTSSQAVDLLDEQFRSNAPTVVAFANAHTLNMTAADPRMRSALNRSVVFNDGLGIDIASRMLFGKPFPDNLNGTDFVPGYLRQTKNRYRIFMVGGQPGIAERAAGELANIAPHHQIVGCSDGYTPAAQVPALLDEIRKSRADILLVAMGNPIQEAWLSEHLQSTGCRLGFGVGGLFDFLAGRVPRAPLWVQSARVEWLFRMIQEPQRLWRRYLLEMPLFLLRVIRQRFAGARVSRVTR